MKSSGSAVSAARWLVGVAAGVVAIFVVATSIAQWVQRAITVRANDIIENAMPSVKLLSSARGNFLRMEEALRRVAAGAGDAAALEAAAFEARENAEAEVTSYRALPFFPHEPALFAPVARAIAALDADYAAWQSSPSTAGMAKLQADFASIDAGFERSIAFDAEQGQRLGLEIEQIRAESRSLLMVMYAAAVVLAAGVVVLAVRQLRRAADLRQRALEARDRREAELAKRNEALGEFAGRLAHDILGPLGNVTLAFHLIRKVCVHDRTALHTIERGLAATDRAHLLVEGLLAFARAGGNPEPGASADLPATLGPLLEELGHEAEARGIALSVPRVPAGGVACSTGVLTSLVSNLVRNAIKYMPRSGEQRISVRIEDAGGEWHFEVEDTGTGIAEDQQQRVFEPHVKLAGGAGIGLGLATVDRLVRAHHGKLGLRSKLGLGSTFWFDLPKAQPAPQADRAS